jgi:hypothetical protein
MGKGDHFRSYMGEPGRVIDDISGNQLTHYPIEFPSLAWAGTYEQIAG